MTFAAPQFTRRACVAASALLLGSLVVSGCGSDEVSTQEPDAKPAPQDVWFEDVAAASGVDFVHDFGPTRYWLPEVMGPGVGLFDMDNDGDLDLYALQGGDLTLEGKGQPSNKLYENQGDGTFVDVTAKAGVGDTGYGMGCAVGDYDSDGFLDLYVTNLGSNVLYRNLGDGTFENVTASAGVAAPGWSTSTGFLDFDSDGLLDLYITQYVDWRAKDEKPCFTQRGAPTWCHPNNYRGPQRDLLYRNRGDGTFEDVTVERGLSSVYGNGLGLVWGQLDKKPGLDVYVANDGMANQLWSGKPEGKWEDRALLMGCALSGEGTAEAGMGVCLEDLNRDGIWDLVVTHLGGETNTFYMGGRRGLKDKTSRSGTAIASQPYTSFGVGMADFDHDGYLDMYVANGRVMDSIPRIFEEDILAEPDQVYRGLEEGRMEELSPRGGTKTEVFAVGRGAAFGDIDNDGDVDVVVGNCGGALRILRNVAKKSGAAVQLQVLEKDGLPAAGAVLQMKVGDGNRMRQVQRTSSYCASNDPRIHVGLGAHSSIDSVSVTWLDGEVEAFGPFPAGKPATLKRGDGR